MSDLRIQNKKIIKKLKIKKLFEGVKMPMKIKIRALTGQTYSIPCEEEDTTLAIKKKLRSKLGVEPEQLQLVFNGRVMNDEKKMSELGIKEAAVIHAVLNLRG